MSSQCHPERSAAGAKSKDASRLLSERSVSKQSGWRPSTAAFCATRSRISRASFELLRDRSFARMTAAHGVLRGNGAVDWMHDWAGEYDADDHQRRRWGWIEHELCAAAFRRDGELFRVCRRTERVGDVSGCEWIYGGSDFFGGVKYPKVAARHRGFERSGRSCEWAVSAWVGEQSVLDWRSRDSRR